MKERCDMLIVGGGMVGAAAALGLAQSGFRVALVEKRPPAPLSRQPVCQVRVSALTRASEALLARLGVWQVVLEHSAHPFRAMRVWSDDVPGEATFRAEEIGELSLGHVVPNAVIQSALWAALEKHDQVSLFSGVTLAQWQRHAAGFQCRLSDGEPVEARFVIGADGADSQVRRLAAIPQDIHEYGQAAIVGCLRTERDHEDTCWQRYTAEGPVAFLAMCDGASSLAWYLPQEKLSWALSLSDEAFAQAVAAAFGNRLGRIVEVGERAGFPLVRRHASCYVKEGVALLGDAAHTVHPQAGQGVNLGFLDVEVLLDEMKAVRALPVSAWHLALKRYERRRYADNLMVQCAMDGFDALFAQDFPWKKPLRRGALALAQSVAPLRQGLMWAALHGRRGFRSA